MENNENAVLLKDEVLPHVEEFQPVIEPTPNEINVDFSNLYDLNDPPKNISSSKIVNCPRILEVLEALPFILNSNIIQNSSVTCVHFIVNSMTEELNEIQLLDLAICLKNLQKSFMIIFESQTKNLLWMYWKIFESQQIFLLTTSANIEGFNNFLKDFLVNSFKDQLDVIHPDISYPKDRLKVIVTINMLADQRGYDLLCCAAESGNNEIVEILTGLWDVKYLVDGKTAADIAFEQKHYETLLILLKANSRFPVDFKLSADNISIPRGLRRFILTSKSIHFAIKSQNFAEVSRIIEANTGLMFFFDIKNNSALSIAIKSKAYEIYEHLLCNNISLGPHEILDDLMQQLTDAQRDTLGEINERRFQCITEKYILVLMSNSNVGPDDAKRQERLSKVAEAFLKLNQIPSIKLLMEIVAATRKFQITFDFNRDHVQFLRPQSEAYVNGLFYFSGNIYIGALHLLDESRAHEVLGVIVHELCHYAMLVVFGNVAKPYRKVDVVNEERFEIIIQRCNELSGDEEIIDSVFLLYDEPLHPAELIVRIPQILAHYIDQPERVHELEEIFVELNKFYNEECVPIMRSKLPEIERKSELQTRKDYANPSNLFKFYWKWLLALFVIFTFGAIALSLLFEPCAIKNCGMYPDVYCKNEGFGRAVCHCPGMIYSDSFKSCFACLTDDDCLYDDNKICFEYSCIYRNNLFNCSTGNQRINAYKRCDGVFDCTDQSDESYNCLHGKFSKFNNSPIFKIFKNVSVECRDFILLTNKNDTIQGIRGREIRNMSYLPISVYLKLPNIAFYEVSKSNIKSLWRGNFKKLYSLETIILHDNKIETIDGHTFKDLHLKTLSLENNKLKKLSPMLFAKTFKLSDVSFAYNSLEKIPGSLFDTLNFLKTVNLSKNNLKSINELVFKKCQQVQDIDLNGNILEYIHHKAFRTENNLTFLNLGNNKCIDMCYSSIALNACLNISSLERDLKQNCSKKKN